MDVADVSPSPERGEEQLPIEASPGRRSAPRGRRWWLLVSIGSILVLAGAYHLYNLFKRSTIKSLSETCREALLAEDWERLESAAASWSEWEPGKAAPWGYLAEAASQTGRYERAAEVLGRLPDSDPMTPPALVVRSSLLFEALNQPLEGALALERAVKLDPKLGEARRRLVYFYAFTLQRRKMVKHAYESIENGCDVPETYVYLIAQDWLSFANAYDENTKWLRGSPDEELFLVARIIYRITSKGLDDEERAAEHAEGVPYHQKLVAEYFERFPQNLELLVYYLRTTSKNGEVEEVARLLSKAPPEAADDNRFWMYKGWLHAARGELQEAETSYRKALLLNCFDISSQHQLAGVLRRLKRFDEVEELEERSRAGKALQREILQLESVVTASRDLLLRVAQFTEDCGDDLVARRLIQRLELDPAMDAKP